MAENNLPKKFVNNMTHELKTPISTVAVALEVLGNYGAINDPQKSKEYIDIAQHEVNRLNMLIDKVLKMSMFENGVIKMSKEEVDLKKIVNAILASMKLHFDKYQVKIDFNCIGEKFTITGDAVHITNVIYNLIDNAIKYSKDNPKINLNLFSKKDTLELTVTDNGIGIPKEDVTKIFAQFYRVPSDNVHDVKGHGLGLNYVQSIIEEHNGKISVESEFGKGSSFIIKLPKTRL